MGHYIRVEVRGQLEVSPLFPPHGVLGIKLWFLGLSASTFTHGAVSCAPVQASRGMTNRDYVTIPFLNWQPCFKYVRKHSVSLEAVQKCLGIKKLV